MPGHSPYTPQEVAHVAGLRASGMTHLEIAQATGIQRRTVSRILARTPVADVVTSATRQQVSDALWRVLAAGTEEALRRIHDPKTRAGELAQLLKVAAEQHAMLTGQATSRTAVVDESSHADWSYEAQQEAQAAAYFDEVLALDDEALAAWAADGGLALLKDASREADRQLAEGKEPT